MYMMVRLAKELHWKTESLYLVPGQIYIAQPNGITKTYCIIPNVLLHNVLV